MKEESVRLIISYEYEKFTVKISLEHSHRQESSRSFACVSLSLTLYFAGVVDVSNAMSRLGELENFYDTFGIDTIKKKTSSSLPLYFLEF